MKYTLMQNEQCGICWDLEFDKQGDKTHEKLNRNSHNFAPLDYCVKCREPKYDPHGFQTHPDETHFMQNQNISISHKFISGIETKYQKKKKRQRHTYAYMGIIITNIVIIGSMLNLFF
jgi:hypothetical protein